jgi:predicted DNA-binding protein (MmcQ/YjbR family)
MSLDTLRTELLSLPAVTAETPFGADALVFKVMGRMFALSTWQETPLRITLKCNPVRALALAINTLQCFLATT